MTSARARARRCRWPPDRSVAGRSPSPSSRTSASVSRTRSAISARGRAPAAVEDLEREGDGLRRGHVGPERGRLKDHSDPPPLGRHVDPGTVQRPPPDADRPRVGALEAGHAAKRGRLAAAGGAEEAEQLSLGDGERDTAQRHGVRGLPLLLEVVYLELHVIPPSRASRGAKRRSARTPAIASRPTTSSSITASAAISGNCPGLVLLEDPHRDHPRIGAGQHHRRGEVAHRADREVDPPRDEPGSTSGTSTRRARCQPSAPLTCAASSRLVPTCASAAAPNRIP